jgi:hypothetical protein
LCGSNNESTGKEMKVQLIVFGENNPLIFTDVKRIEKNVVFTIIFIKNEKILNSKSYLNSDIKQMVITNE